MTLLDESILIRSKFRKVLQLRIQNRRQQNEITSDPGGKRNCNSQLGEREGKSVSLPDESTTHRLPPGGGTNETAKGPVQDWGAAAGFRQKRARLAEDLSEKIQRRPGPLELFQKHILPLETAGSITLPPPSSEDDVSSSSSSSSPEQLGIHQSPGVVGDQSLSDLSPASACLSRSPNSLQCSLALLPATEGIRQPIPMTVADSDCMAIPGRAKGIYLTTQGTPLLPKTAQMPPKLSPQSTLSSVSPARPPRSKKPRDSKPKMKKLKYHQYIPPDQRSGTGVGGGGGAAQKGLASGPTIDPAYSRLLQEQQVFLQLQILNQQQQQQQLTISPSHDPQIVRFTGTTSPACPQPVSTATNTSLPSKPELLPPNLDDLTVSDLRKHLRNRGLPVSGTKPSLLERLRPYQLPRPCLPPAPLCPPGSVLGASSSPDLTSTTAPVYIGGHVGGAETAAGVGFLTIAPPTGPIPLLGSSPPSAGTPWRPGQSLEEPRGEREAGKKHVRVCPQEKGADVAEDGSGECSLHPFLQQETGCQTGTADTNGQAEVLFTQVFCCQPCEPIGQDFELPMQITASPVQASSRSLEEELQEAIQRVLMAPSQSIDDILDEPISGADAVASVSELQAAAAALSRSPPSPLADQSQPFLPSSKDENLLSSPLCSSLLLELPPSPSNVVHVAPQPPPPPPPPPICTTPPAAALSRKRWGAAAIDPADWLESLTSSLRPLTPPPAPFVECDFGLDTDLSVTRVLDLMVEQW